MSESFRKRFQAETRCSERICQEKGQAYQSAKAGKRWQDSDGDGKWYEPGEDVKKEEVCAPAKVDDSEAKQKAKDRMKAKMMQMTADHDAKRQGYKAAKKKCYIG